MSYRPAIGPRLAGGTALPPHVVCNGCQAIKIALTKRGDAPQWLLKRTAPPGWLLERREAFNGVIVRRDYCPVCRKRLGAGLERGKAGGRS